MPRQQKVINQEFPVSFQYDVCFTEGLFETENTLFAELIQRTSPKVARKVLFVFDQEMYRHHPDLFEQIEVYAGFHENAFILVEEPVILPGGEASKNDRVQVKKVHDAINEANLDRHSYVCIIGGGAVIDAAGYAAATAHRGIRTIRVPTTVLAQNDAAVGVKNGINAYGKKNFLGTFVPPFAVINDVNFLVSLDQRDWRSGISEAVKVALLKDADFFEFLEENAEKLDSRDLPAMQKLIYRCAELHLDHIATSGDPFEMGSSRPLDFGHWSAHKLEQLTHYDLRHGEAVAIGIALDVSYSFLAGMITEKEWNRILDTFKACGFDLFRTGAAESLG
ncbi:MAG: 3-dehydroquinate synthase [Balneolaceae bacterium]|nr:3-dehydroquinate synthase [Balneolaceae bacterium]